MICTKCRQPIKPKKNYCRTKKGFHHYTCPNPIFSDKQNDLAAKHGTPPEFARAVYQTVPEFLSMDEARIAIDKYNKEWNEAASK